MKVLLASMILSVCIGTFWERKLPKLYLVPTIALTILVMIAYYVFNKT